MIWISPNRNSYRGNFQYYFIQATDCANLSDTRHFKALKCLLTRQIKDYSTEQKQQVCINRKFQIKSTYLNPVTQFSNNTIIQLSVDRTIEYLKKLLPTTIDLNKLYNIAPCGNNWRNSELQNLCASIKFFQPTKHSRIIRRKCGATTHCMKGMLIKLGHLQQQLAINLYWKIIRSLEIIYRQ